jgi:hypothetical protein
VALRKVVVTVGTVRLVVKSVAGISCLVPVLGAGGLPFLCSGVAEGLVLREAVGEDLFFSAVAVDAFLFGGKAVVAAVFLF